MEKRGHLEEILINAPQSRSVGIEITNKTRVTLRRPSYFCQSGQILTPPSPSISPQSRETCVFVKKQLSPWGVSGLLAYESDLFSFAVMFYNPMHNSVFPHQYAVEIYTTAICGSLESLYKSMRGDRPQSCTYRKELLDKNASSIVVSSGSFQISATMSNHDKSVLKLLLEETPGPPPQYAPYDPSYPKSDFPKEMRPPAFSYLKK
ncbi:uncharacterized protein [Apteryx mantelli]|uniref:Uncharacterized protein n=1 Tax=Apteryx mantelli TaxID=2696672 RepID=A0A8B7IBB6_9AVES|nr:PREDICTED: uncharacterized protein LOC106482038 [Apteryx mantelli mantelli]